MKHFKAKIMHFEARMKHVEAKWSILKLKWDMGFSTTWVRLRGCQGLNLHMIDRFSVQGWVQNPGLPSAVPGYVGR